MFSLLTIIRFDRKFPSKLLRTKPEGKKGDNVPQKKKTIGCLPYKYFAKHRYLVKNMFILLITLYTLNQLILIPEKDTN